MNVIHRNNDITRDTDVKIDKMIVLFNWIKEFRFTDAIVATKLLSVNRPNGHRFLSRLVEQGYIVKFENTPSNTNLYALTQLGVNFLKEHDLAYSDELAYEYARYKKTIAVIHHLELQKYLASSVSIYSEIVWEYNLDSNTYRVGEIRPDCVVTYQKNNIKVAIEYERWSKTKPRIYYKFYKHLENIQRGLYSGVSYVFEDEKDYKTYLKLFNETHWPRYKLQRNKNNSNKLVKLTQSFNAQSVKGIEKVFNFRVS